MTCQPSIHSYPYVIIISYGWCPALIRYGDERSSTLKTGFNFSYHFISAFGPLTVHSVLSGISCWRCHGLGLECGDVFSCYNSTWLWHICWRIEANISYQWHTHSTSYTLYIIFYGNLFFWVSPWEFCFILIEPSPLACVCVPFFVCMVHDRNGSGLIYKWYTCSS